MPEALLNIPVRVEAPLLVQGDCIELMRQLPADSIDAVVDDPPAGIGFMGKGWDSFRAYEPRTGRGLECAHALALLGLAPWAAGFVLFMVDVHTEARRVMKPGAYMVTWALPRTADLAGLALRLAGFDACDSLLHLFGSGFPKSHDIGKALDKMHGAEREVVGIKTYAGGLGPESYGSAPTTARGFGVADSGEGGNFMAKRGLTAPATDDARRWEGWGTALAPGHEQWLLARKPTRLTYARNVLDHGCGALHIDACRVPTSEVITTHKRSSTTAYDGIGELPVNDTTPRTCGRWPSNVLLSGGDVCEELDRQSGVQRSQRATKRNDAAAFSSGTKTAANPTRPSPSYAGEPDGGASRYFPRFRYQAKARDRRAGLRTDIDNRHPTHKHPDLMRWLQRLVTPTAKQTGDKPGIVLSRFLGSGTDGVAAVAEGFRFVGFELDPVSIRIITEHGPPGCRPPRKRSRLTRGRGRARCQPGRRKDVCGEVIEAPRCELCAELPNELMSFHIARARIMAAIGSPEAAAEANASAPTGAQLSLV